MANLELEIAEKRNIIHERTISTQNPKTDYKCDECDRLVGIIKELELQLDWYKQSVLRKSANKTDTGYYHSDMKYYYEDQEAISNFETESIEKSLKDLKFHITPNSKGKKRGKHQKNLSFITINAKNEADRKATPKRSPRMSPNLLYSHTYQTSHCGVPQNQPNPLPKHHRPKTNSVNPKSNTHISIEPKGRIVHFQQKSKGLSGSKNAEKVSDYPSFNSIMIEKSPDHF